MTDTTKQAEPFAWATFDGEGGYDLRLYEDNESYRIDYYDRNGAKYEGWVKPLYSADTVREMQLAAIRETIKEALYQLGRSAKYGGCSDAEVMSWVDPETVLENLK